MMIIERLSREHRNIEKLLAILERELEVFSRGDRPEYDIIHDILSYFQVYLEIYHHPQENLVFAKLRTRDPTAAEKVGDLLREHKSESKRLHRVAQMVELVLADRAHFQQFLNTAVRDFIEHERLHILIEDNDFFTAALKSLYPQDWAEIASGLINQRDSLFSDVAEGGFDMLRMHIYRLAEDAEAERRGPLFQRG